MRGKDKIRQQCQPLLLLNEMGVQIVMARSSKLESGFQDRLRDELLSIFPGCMIFKMDQIQGIPDLLILYKNVWASLECKKSERANKQPNQEYYVGVMNEMSFSRFIYPENRTEVINELQHYFYKVLGE